MISEADILKKLNLGSSKAVLDNAPNNPLAQLLQVQVNDIVKDLRTNLDKYNADASGNLKQSIAPTKASVKGSEVSVEIEAPFYWKFVNYGVNGSLVNRGAPNWGTQSGGGGWKEFEKEISSWIRSRGITLPSQFSSYESFNYVIRKSIREKGKQARPFFSDVVNDALIRELSEPISILMGRAIEIKITEPWQ